MRIMMKLVSFVGYWRTDSLCPWWAVTWYQNTWSGNKTIIMYQCFFAWIIAGKIEEFIPHVQNHGLIQHFCLFQIRTIDRNMEIPHKGAFCDILFFYNRELKKLTFRMPGHWSLPDFQTNYYLYWWKASQQNKYGSVETSSRGKQLTSGCRPWLKNVVCLSSLMITVKIWKLVKQ